MNGSKQPRFLLDTNVILYYLGKRLANPLAIGKYSLSVITEIELLSYSKITSTEELNIRRFLNQITVVGIEPQVKEATIEFRRSYRLRLPDAVIAATAKHLNATLLTNDAALLNLAEINTQSVSIK